MAGKRTKGLAWERNPRVSFEGRLALGSSNHISKDTGFAKIGDRHSYVITVVVDINSYSSTGNSPETLDSHRREQQNYDARLHDGINKYHSIEREANEHLFI